MTYRVTFMLNGNVYSAEVEATTRAKAVRAIEKKHPDADVVSAVSLQYMSGGGSKRG